MKLLSLLALAGALALAALFLLTSDHDDDDGGVAPGTPDVSGTPTRAARPSTPRAEMAPSPHPPPAAAEAQVVDAAATGAPRDPDDPRWARNDPKLEFFTSELRESGAPSGSWSALPDRLIATWRSGLAPQLAERVRFEPFECFERGCITTAVYDNEASYQELNDALPELDAFRDYPGWRHRSAPTRDASGRVSVTWVFMSPPQT
jgi:hypothetical protein